MRTISLCLLSALGLSWCLVCHSVQTLESASTREPLPLPPALDDPPNFRPQFHPGANPNSLLAVFASLASRSSSPPDSPRLASIQNSAAVTDARDTTSHVEPVSDMIPDDFSISAWTSPKFFTDLSEFNITHFAAGRDNLEVVVGITPGVEDIVHADDASESSWNLWKKASAMLQLFYPKDSVNPARRPQGGSEFYAKPLDISKANNVTLEYKVFFPGDFDWVKGGKLPGLRGGPDPNNCSGGNQANGSNCFSSRIMWRKDGDGEGKFFSSHVKNSHGGFSCSVRKVYAYVPRVNRICNDTGVQCNDQYGISLNRGSFGFLSGQCARYILFFLLWLLLTHG